MFLFKLSKFPFLNCQNFPFQTVKMFLFKLSKISFSNCQNVPFQTVKISFSKLWKCSFSNCQNFFFQTVKMFLFKLSKFPFSKLSKFPFSNCQKILVGLPKKIIITWIFLIKHTKSKFPPSPNRFHLKTSNGLVKNSKKDLFVKLPHFWFYDNLNADKNKIFKLIEWKFSFFFHCREIFHLKQYNFPNFHFTFSRFSGVNDN
jgi:hypothetical protein